MNIPDSIYYILTQLIEKDSICIKTIGKITEKDEKKMNDLLNSTYQFFKYFNNNYRPIYHLENYILYLVKHVHEL